jgi:hypothetical protein
MGYILKNTSGLMNIKITDAGRQKLSQGRFNISYFQIGDSEMLYNKLPSSYLISNSMVLESGFNAQNMSGVPESNKQNIKYPYYVDGDGGNTYGLPTMDSGISPIYNTAAMRGFFSADTTSLPTNWSVLVSSGYTLTSNFMVDMSSLDGTNTVTVSANTCNVNQTVDPSPGDFVTIYYDNMGTCVNDELMEMLSCYPILTYRVVDYCANVLTLDRNAPDFTNINLTNVYSRLIVYPKQMTDLYDSVTPLNHYSDNIINFESVCAEDEFDVKIWNMNIPWSETLAGIDSFQFKDYSKFGSVDYLGTKEYLGYMSNSGQTFFISNQFSAETTDTYYYNSFGEIIEVEPEEQKAIGIIHYTNQTIDLFYGEKFALQPYEAPFNTTGQARNFRLHLPWLMWHKNPECCMGETFWVDPPGFDDLQLFETGVRYVQSTKNDDMNEPGIRYYHLWDTNANPDGYPSRVGKVFPDDRIIVIDDEELLAAMSYKSNRNWTIPAPKLFLSTPNTCNSIGDSQGVLTGSNQTMFVTYRFTNTTAFTNSLHCNYYSKIQGPNNICNPSDSENVGVRFGDDFPCLTGYSNTYRQGFFGEKLEILCQKVTTGSRPQPDEWRVIDFTSDLSATTVNGYITKDGLTGTTFVITNNLYNSAPLYNLDDYITLTGANDTGQQLNFGDEYYFYGSLETDIQATIYEMVCKVNLSDTEFKTSSNPTWNTTTKPYLTEIGLYDDQKNLMFITKLQSPVLRQGIQQFLIKFDF